MLQLIQVLAVVPLLHTSNTPSCDVARFYRRVDSPVGAVAITSLGEVVDVEELLVPVKVDAGTYSVTVTRKGSNLYRLGGLGLYVQTRLCLELALSEDATLVVRSVGGFALGELIFRD